jgi:membrane protease YdiL (CAAX protease family)
MAGLGVSAIAVKWEKRPFSSLGFALGKSWFIEFGLGIVGGAFIVGTSALLIRMVGGFHWNSDPAGSLWRIGLGFLFFLAVGMDEEISFRGYPFQRLVEEVGIWPALAVLALPFAALHLGNPGISVAGTTLKLLTIINIMLMSILLSLCFIRTRSLALPIGLHLGWNWVQGNVMGFGVSGTTFSRGFWTPVLHDKPVWLTGGTIGVEGSLACTLVTSMTIVVLIFWKYSIASTPTPPLEEGRGGLKEQIPS